MKVRKQKSEKILVSGSIVIDSLFDLSSNISDHINIENGTLGTQNLMFTANEKREFYGGTAGNISYGLSLLGKPPLLASVVGKDFSHEYRKHLQKMKVALRAYEDKDGFTATFYGMSDTKKQQIGIFQPNAYGKHAENIPLSKLLTKNDIKNISVAIFSPGTAKSITNHIEEFRKLAGRNATVIFDPGQTLMATFTKPLLQRCLRLSSILIGNEVEIKQIKEHFGISTDEIFAMGVNMIIETLGEDGSIAHLIDRRIKIPAVKVRNVVDPTGAGDAYRAGLLYGLSSSLSSNESMKIAAILGAECVKHIGGQTYSLSFKRGRK